MSTTDDEIRRITAELDGLMVGLRANVDALRAILVPPGDVPPESSERLVSP